MELTRRDREMLDGAHGEAARFAMSVVSRMAEALQAEELLSIEQAHIDACALMSPSSLELVRYLADHGGQVSVPTTLSMVSLDLEHWETHGVPEDFASTSLAIAAAYRTLGCIPTWTCAPYQGYLTPRFGQQIAWGESNAVAYANSVHGARTNRYADYLDICAAITGRVPHTGLHRTENRQATIHFELHDTKSAQWQTDAAWAAFGSLVGQLAGEQVPVIDGLPPLQPTNDMLKAFGAAVASSGSVALFHLVRHTPEALTLGAACQGEIPKKSISLGPSDLRSAWHELSQHSPDGEIQAVILGCPHFSYAEFEQLARLIEQAAPARVHPNVSFKIFCSAADLELARRGGLLETLDSFGVTLVRDTCPFHSPLIKGDVRAIATNSGKCAYYAPGELGVDIRFAAMEACVQAAITGSMHASESPW